MRPPLMMWISVRKKAGRSVKLWLPLIILWPLILVAAVLFIPIAFICDRIFGSKALLMGFRIYSVLCATRGLSVDVKQQNDSVRVYII